MSESDPFTGQQVADQFSLLFKYTQTVAVTDAIGEARFNSGIDSRPAIKLGKWACLSAIEVAKFRK
jgi:hypothetical protein